MYQIKNLLYLGWLGKGNVGDDVLYEQFKHMFYRYSLLDRRKYIVNIDAYPVVEKYEVSLDAYDVVVLGGGSLIHLSYWLNICEKCVYKGIPVVTWGTGYDDFFKPKDIEKIPFNRIQLPLYKSIYEQFSHLSVRGPYTKIMLKNIGVESEIHELGDPAFVYEPNRYEIYSKSTNTILINWGTAFNHIFGNDESSIENELVKVINILIEQGYNIIVYPIWTEDIIAVKTLTEKVNHPSCTMLSMVYDAKTLQNKIQQAYMTINFKLHATILSASVNTPFVSLAYRGKCFEFAQTVQCIPYTISTDEANYLEIMKKIHKVKEEYDDIITKLEEAKMIYFPRLINTIQVISGLLN